MPPPLFDPAVPFPGGVFRAVILRVVDGDTVAALCDLGFSVTRTLHVRLAGINAAELHGGTEASRARAQAARAFLVGYEGRTGLLVTRQTKSFDRYVGDVVVDGQSLAAALLAAGLVDAYAPA
jgi:endonuclease YncB( thermonuclease family)